MLDEGAARGKKGADKHAVSMPRSPRKTGRGSGPLRFAGFLPLCLFNGRWWALLGKEADGWGAFGGGPEATEQGEPSQTAIREAVEESHGVLSPIALQEAVAATYPLLLTARAAVYGVVVPRVVLSRMQKTFAKLRHMQPSGGCYEKTDAALVPLRFLRNKRQGRPARAVRGRPLRAPLDIDEEASHVRQALSSLQAAFDAEHWDAQSCARRVGQQSRHCRVIGSEVQRTPHRRPET